MFITYLDSGPIWQSTSEPIFNSLTFKSSTTLKSNSICSSLPSSPRLPPFLWCPLHQFPTLWLKPRLHPRSPASIALRGRIPAEAHRSTSATHRANGSSLQFATLAAAPRVEVLPIVAAKQPPIANLKIGGLKCTKSESETEMGQRYLKKESRNFALELTRGDPVASWLDDAICIASNQYKFLHLIARKKSDV